MSTPPAPEQFNEQEEALLRWKLAIVSQGEGVPKIERRGDSIVLRVGHELIADYALDYADRYFSEDLLRRIKIFVGREIYFSLPTNHSSINTMIQQQILRSHWAQANSKLLEYEQTRNTVFVYSRDSNSGYRCLDIVAYLGLANGSNRILALDADDQINKPIILDRTLVPHAEEKALARSQRIGEMKRELIERVATSDQVESLDYSMVWAPPGGRERNWPIKIVGIPVNRDEIVIFSQNADASQVGYWQAVRDQLAS